MPVSTAPGSDIPALHEQLAVLVSTGKAKEATGVQLSQEQEKHLSDKHVEKYTKRYETQFDRQLNFSCNQNCRNDR